MENPAVLRAALLGVVLAFVVAVVTPFNDQVIRQTPLIGSHFPVAVFGVLLAVLLTTNGLLAWRAPRWAWRGRELALAAAVALPACGWPGANFARYFAPVVSEPVRVEPIKPLWQATGVLSYVPGGAAALAAGHVTDAARLREHISGDGGPAATIRARLSPAAQADPAHASVDDLLRACNRWIRAEGAEAPARRAQLAAAWPDAVLPAPPGGALLLHRGVNRDDLHAALAAGASSPDQRTTVPWHAWFPTLALWLGLVLLMALAAFALTLIVHPQWARHEQLLYPVARVFGDIVGVNDPTPTPGAPPRRLPLVMRHRGFWVGFALVAAFHGLNLAAAWFPGLPRIARSYDLMSLTEIFPTAKRVMHHGYLFYPSLFPIVVALGYFISARVALSIWGGLLLWVTLGAALVARGVAVDNTVLRVGAAGPTLRFGALLAAAALILYFGRRAYAAVAARAVGLPGPPAPPTTVWAFRALTLTVIAAVVLLWRGAGISPVPATLLVLAVLAFWLVIGRIHAETGLFFFEPNLLPATMIATLLGVRGVGVENLAALGLAGIVLTAGARESLMPFALTALRLRDAATPPPAAPAAPAASALPAARPALLWPMALVLIVTLPLATAVTLHLQYTHGLSPTDRWATDDLALKPFDELARTIQSLRDEGTLAAATRVTGLDHLRQLQPDPHALAWLATGALLFLTCSLARLRLPWWPLHPVAFLTWGTTFASNCAFSFLLAGLLKTAVLRCGGVRLDRQVRPVMLGVIAGELLAALAMILLGLTWFLLTGHRPPTYHILPS